MLIQFKSRNLGITLNDLTYAHFLINGPLKSRNLAFAALSNKRLCPINAPLMKHDLTGLHIYTGESKVQGPTEGPGGHYEAAGFGFARIDTQAS